MNETLQIAKLMSQIQDPPVAFEENKKSRNGLFTPTKDSNHRDWSNRMRQTVGSFKFNREASLSNWQRE